MPKLTTAPPFEQLLTQAKMTNALLAAQLLLHMTQQDVVALLRSTGAGYQQISEVLGASYATVAVSAGRARQKAERKKGRDDGEVAQEEPAEMDLREAGSGSEQPE